MIKRKIALLVLAATLSTNVLTTVNASAQINTVVSEERSVEVNTSGITVSNFDVMNNKNYAEYAEAFKVTNIKSYSNNGGKYGSSTLDKAFDGNKSTHWETGKPNGANHTNEVIVTFEEVEEINRIVYAARQDASNKGYATKFSVYTSLTEEGDDFELVGSGNSTRTSNYSEFKFQNTNFKRLKFVFDEASDYWASASEFMFFKEDTLTDTINDIFVDGTQTKLAEGITEETLAKLEEDVMNHPLKSAYEAALKNAQELFKNPSAFENDAIVTASQRGDSNKEASEHQIARTSYSLDTFGRYVTPGETIQLYVDADENGVMPKLCFGQIADDKNGWSRFYTLKPGLNTITAPSFDTMAPAIIYIYNPAKPQDQAYAPRVRLVGGTAFPVYYHGVTDPADYERELNEYVAKVSTNDSDFANGVRDDVFYNVTELVSENNTLSTSAKGALVGINEMKANEKTVADTMNDWEKLWHAFQKFSGFVDGDEDSRNDLFNVKFTSRVFTKGPYGWSDWGYTGYNGGDTVNRDDGNFKAIVKPFSLVDDWMFFHEWGHNINNSRTEHVEVTNNLFSAEMRRVFGTGGDAIDWTTLYSKFSGNEFNLGFFTNLGVLSQPLYYYGTDSYGKASRVARTNPDGILDGLSNNQQRYVVAFSVAVGYDLTDFFENWNYCTATDLMKQKVSNLPKPDVKLEYMHTSGVDYTGTGFTDETVVSINSIKTDASNSQNTLQLSVDAESKSAAMGYEIFRNGELVGYTVNTSFVDKNIDANEDYTYEVVAYDKKLNTAKKVSRSTSAPNIKVDSQVVLDLYDEFNITDYISAVDNLGNDISSNVTIVNSDLDMNKRGSYTVEVQVENNGQTENATLNVKVVSESVYVSDMAWKSSNASYGSIKKDKSHGNSSIVLSDTLTKKTYTKGLGMHAISEVVIDVDGKDFTTFESYVGADGNSGSNATSVNFQVFVDGEKKYDSGRMTINTAKQHISVDVSNAKEVKLVMSDSGNGISNDSGVWADAKFTKTSSKPKINAEETTFVQIREDLNLLEGITANDIEDGDLTSNIVVDNGGFNPNKTGEYIVKYTVSDSDNNTTVFDRKVVVYSGIEYASDIEWTSARTDWSTVKKDLSSSGGAMKLGINGETTLINKGLGVHANGEVVYNLEGTNYEYFESLVGVDRSISEQNNSSVIFKIFADGIEVYNSGLMKWQDNAKLVRIPVKNVSELKLVVDNAGNGNTSDHGSFGDAKFLMTNTKPTLTIPSDLTTKVGEAIDLTGEYSALDAEDGNLTDKVETTGKVNFNKSGSYKINYTVTDSDGNKVTKARTIKVVNMDDYTYLSDINWKSANTSWGQVRKNLSASSNTLRLTGENGQEVSYANGIGTHSTSTITYDLTNTDYGYFTSYVGVDRGMYGSVGSVVFQVYLDGTKVYDSGLMTSKQAQKFVEVNLQGAKEMKLVVTDGGNGNGSDHATFGDAKFHYAKEVEVDYSELENVINTVSGIDKSIYTEETVKVLEAALVKAQQILADKIATEAEVKSIISKVEEAKNSLVKENLDQVVNIENSELKNIIKETLQITSDNITVGDMRKLTSLSADSNYINNLSGLEYATNLENLTIDHSEVKDLSPLKDLTKLKNISMVDGFISVGMAQEVDGKATIEGNVIDINGENILPSEIVIVHRTGNTSINLEENIIDNKVQIDSSNFKAGANTIVLKYKSDNANFNTNLIYILMK